MSLRRFIVLALVVLSLTACSSNPRRVSPPAASIQQLTVEADGTWKIDLRLQNYSNVPMRFATIDLALTVNGQDAGNVHATPEISIGPEIADVVSVTFAPTSTARLYAADVLARRGTLNYTLKGGIDAAPQAKKKARHYDIDARNALSPAPGLPGVLR